MLHMTILVLDFGTVKVLIFAGSKVTDFSNFACYWDQFFTEFVSFI